MTLARVGQFHFDGLAGPVLFRFFFAYLEATFCKLPSKQPIFITPEARARMGKDQPRGMPNPRATLYEIW